MPLVLVIEDEVETAGELAPACPSRILTVRGVGYRFELVIADPPAVPARPVTLRARVGAYRFGGSERA